MRQVHCDGCGVTEPEGTPQKKQQIREVTLMVLNDPRWPESEEKFTADLCPNCRGMVLHTYFKIPAEGKLELPAFIGPRMLEAEGVRS